MSILYYALKAGLIWVSTSCLGHGLHVAPRSTIRTISLAGCQLPRTIIWPNPWGGWWHVCIPPPVYLLVLACPSSPCTQDWINISTHQLLGHGVGGVPHTNTTSRSPAGCQLSAVSFQHLSGPIPRVIGGIYGHHPPIYLIT